MRLTIWGDKLLLLDWFDDKTNQLSTKLHKSITFMPIDEMNGNDQKFARFIMQELDAYFNGTLYRFSIPLDVSHGTDFQVKVWQMLMNITYGETISYKELATQIGNPNAFRACANANGKNPISLIVPCHRVIASDGSIGGYTGGIGIKETLLNFEKQYNIKCK
ncbi:methylated-DNA--[protein]-cysteine S-methyltransferase [Moraxella oblonga]|uniref:methylated-DNA--[protein]-cysteine S-methyltransferase n=1 Tax=Moraxella oblonga TaxID=200413 RepID=UPI0012ED2F5B|nr:methylated-DNA--[protein]-cysteine S-methyltransferase [Moraxella oblonga]